MPQPFASPTASAKDTAVFTAFCAKNNVTPTKDLLAQITRGPITIEIEGPPFSNVAASSNNVIIHQDDDSSYPGPEAFLCQVQVHLDTGYFETLLDSLLNLTAGQAQDDKTDTSISRAFAMAITTRIITPPQIFIAFAKAHPTQRIADLIDAPLPRVITKITARLPKGKPPTIAITPRTWRDLFGYVDQIDEICRNEYNLYGFGLSFTDETAIVEVNR